MNFFDWFLYCLIWLWLGAFIITPLLILFKTIITNEVVKQYEIDLSISIVASILSGMLTFIVCFFFMYLIFL